MSEDRIIKFTESLREAAEHVLAVDPTVVLMGLGVSYPKGADGTTAGLKSKYPERVFDVPVSEDAVTGMGVGAAIHGLRPIVHHGRVEFALFAADQIFSQAAKWNYMFGGGNPVPIVFRINIGRQWGNGPQHTQSLVGLFGSATGLKVVVPSSPFMAKGLLIAAVRDDNPVVLLEPRWLFQTRQEVPEGPYTVALDRARVVQEGDNVTVVSYGDGVVAAQEAIRRIGKDVGIELIDLVSINPIDEETLLRSVRKTRRIVTVDMTNKSFSVGSEVLSRVVERLGMPLVAEPARLACPDVPVPTSTALSDRYYPTWVDIANAVLGQVGMPAIEASLSFADLHVAPSVVIDKDPQHHEEKE